MTDADAQAEGDYETVAEFREPYTDIYGEWDGERVVDVVEFEYVGREQPTSGEVTQLRLDRCGIENEVGGEQA